MADTALRVLVACEESQEICKAFRALGHEAFSCDILPCSGGHAAAMAAQWGGNVNPQHPIAGSVSKR